MTDANIEQGQDKGKNLPRPEPMATDEDDEATSLHSPPVPAVPAPHRTPEEAKETSSAEHAPLPLDPSWNRDGSTGAGQ